MDSGSDRVNTGLAPTTTPKTGSLKDKAYKAIREAIINYDLRPNARLSEAGLAEQLDMSRTPIREALKQLEEEGLVRIVPRHGAFVTDISTEDIVQIYQVREALECFAIQFISEQTDTSELDELISAFEQAEQWIEKGEIDKINEADVHLHRYIVRLPRNPLLVKLVDQLLNQVVRLRMMTPRIEGRLHEQAQEHLRIVYALKRGDVDEAVRAHQAHLRNVRSTFLQLRLGIDGALVNG
jgi:DNA-binding GntR family transcriptional regulator